MYVSLFNCPTKCVCVGVGKNPKQLWSGVFFFPGTSFTTIHYIYYMYGIQYSICTIDSSKQRFLLSADRYAKKRGLVTYAWKAHTHTHVSDIPMSVMPDIIFRIIIIIIIIIICVVIGNHTDVPVRAPFLRNLPTPFSLFFSPHHLLP